MAARSAAFRFKGETYDIKEVGRQLRVGSVIEGAIRVAGERLRITVELVQVADGYVLWSERFDREMKDIFDIQDEVCGAIVDALQKRLVTGGSYTPARRPTGNMAAYDAYLKGNNLLTRLSPSELRRGAALLEEASRLDEAFVLPLVGLSVYHSSMAIQGHARSQEALPRAETLALQALRIDDRLPEAHRAHGIARQFQWDWPGAEAALRRAIDLQPTYAQAHADLAFGKILRGGGDEAVRDVARVLELAPLEPMYGWFMTQALCLAGHHERAIAQAEATLAIDPHYMPIFWWLGTAQWLLGRREEAVETVTKLLPFGDAMGDGLYAFFAGQLGRTDEARAAAVKLETQWHEGHLLQGTALVSAWVGVGETDRALDWLETACEERNASLVLLSVPWFDTLRAEPRFQAVLRTVGL